MCVCVCVWYTVYMHYTYFHIISYVILFYVICYIILYCIIHYNILHFPCTYMHVHTCMHIYIIHAMYIHACTCTSCTPFTQRRSHTERSPRWLFLFTLGFRVKARWLCCLACCLVCARAPHIALLAVDPKHLEKLFKVAIRRAVEDLRHAARSRVASCCACIERASLHACRRHRQRMPAQLCVPR